MKANHLPNRTVLNIRFMTRHCFFFVGNQFRQKTEPNVDRKLTLNADGKKIREFRKFGKTKFL